MSSVDNLNLLGKKTCHVVVHRARNLKPKGKDSKNNAFVTISLGKEKFATSVVEKSQNPEWNEDCQLPIRPQDSKLELTVLHQDFFLERFLGKVEIQLSDVESRLRKSSKRWYKLMGKQSKGKKEEKHRGDLEVTVEIKGNDPKVVNPMQNPLTKREHLDIPESSPLRKTISTPHIANKPFSIPSSNPFDEPDVEKEEAAEPSSLEPEIAVTRLHSHDTPPPHLHSSQSAMKTSQSHHAISQRTASPKFQRLGMGRKIVRTSFRKEKVREEVHASTPNLTHHQDEPDSRYLDFSSISPVPSSPSPSPTPTSSAAPETASAPRRTSITNLPSLGKLRKKSKSVVIPTEEFAVLRKEHHEPGVENGTLQRAVSEECLSKSQEDMLHLDERVMSPTPEQPKRRQYKPGTKSARRAKAVSQYYESTPPDISLYSQPEQKPVAPVAPVRHKTAGSAPYENLPKELELEIEEPLIPAKIRTARSSPYENLKKEELIKILVEKDQEIKDKNKMMTEMEKYIDELLLKVIISAPGLLDQGFQPKPTMRPKSPVQRYQAKKQEIIL